MLEKQTRKELIDKALLKAGWDVNDKTKVAKEYYIKDNISLNESPYTYDKNFADYILLGNDNYPLAIVEAKKTMINAQAGKQQAFDYAKLISEKSNREMPVIFYTNGYDLYCWESEIQAPKKVLGFPTHDDLERRQFLIKNKINFTQVEINSDISGRPYQMQAIRAVTEEIEKAKSKFLLVMATGTGKTRTCIGLIDVLMRANRVQRVLFLVDRIALQEQAVEAIQDYLPHTTIWPHKNEKDLVYGRRVYVVTYPTLLNEIQKETCRFSPHYFDLIIADESHRSIYNTYKQIFQYFNAIQLGLTATPTDRINHDTFELFNCDKGIPTFAYSYKQAVENVPPYLCDFEVLKFRSLYQKDGISHSTILETQKDKLIAEGTDIDSISYEGSDLEKKVSNRGTNELIVSSFMEDSIKDPEGVLPGKTIMFCMSKAHAYRMEDIFNTFYPEYKGKIAEVLVSEKKGVYGKGGLLDKFKNSNLPRIAISVDMLDTGVDVREVVNLVFAKPVFSYTKFWQMIGRGTRILDLDKMKNWCISKEKFLIIDCWDNFDYFKIKAKGRDLKAQTPLPVKLFRLRLKVLQAAITTSQKEIVDKQKNKLKELISILPEQSIVVKDIKRKLDIVKAEEFWDNLTIDKINVLENSIAPVFRVLSSCDFKAMRFENDIIEYSLMRITSEDSEAEFVKQKIISNVKKLPLSINTVAVQEKLINEIINHKRLDKANDSELEHIITSLAPLMRFRSKQENDFVELDIADRVITHEYIEFGAENEQLSVEKYKQLMELKIRNMIKSNNVLQKIRDNKEISDDELSELAKNLHNTDLDITQDKLQKIYQNRKATLIQFMKHILGCEPLLTTETIISNAIDRFIAKHLNYSSKQIEFMMVLKKVLIDNNRITRKDLTLAPFTQLNQKGILGLFDKIQREEIIALIEKISA